METREQSSWPSFDEARRLLSEVGSYEALVRYLQEWTASCGGGIYDTVGMLGLFKACVFNLEKNWSPEEDPGLVKESFTEKEIEFLRRLLVLLGRA